MGICYLWACDERRAFLREGNDKRPEQAAPLVALLLRFGSWQGASVRIVSDNADEEFFGIVDNWEDAGPEARELVADGLLAKD